MDKTHLITLTEDTSIYTGMKITLAISAFVSPGIEIPVMTEEYLQTISADMLLTTTKKFIEFSKEVLEFIPGIKTYVFTADTKITSFEDVEIYYKYEGKGQMNHIETEHDVSETGYIYIPLSDSKKLYRKVYSFIHNDYAYTLLLILDLH